MLPIRGDGTDAHATTQDRDYRHGDFAAAPASGDAGFGIVGAEWAGAPDLMRHTGMVGGESGRQLYDDLTPGCSGTSPGGKQRLIRGGGWILMAAGVVVQNKFVFPGHGGHFEQPVLQAAGSRSTQQSDGQHSGAVKVSAALVDVTQKRVDRPVSIVPNSNDADINCASRLVRQAELASGLSLLEEFVTGVDCHDFVVGRPTSASLGGADGCVDFSGDVAIGVTSPAVFAGGISIGVKSLAIAGVASPAVAGVASPADGGVASLADLAGGVTVGVTSPADAGVAFLPDARVASLADLAGGVTVGVTSLANAGVASLADIPGGVTVGVASLADAGVVYLADLAGNVAGGVTFLADPVREGMWCSEWFGFHFVVTMSRTILLVMNWVLLTFAKI